METIIRNVAELAPLDRSSVERVVGHELRDSEQLVIQVITSAVPPSIPVGQAIPEWCNVFQGLSDAEVDHITSTIVRDRSTRTLP
jgi:hypothetical protein